MISQITLSGMEFYAHHGCFEEERLVGSRFLVDLVLEYDATEAIINDNVSLALNYQTVFVEVKKIMAQPVNLLETLCSNILTMLKSKFSQIISAEVNVAKLNPTLTAGGKIEKVKVKLQII